jgi:heme oxygenase
VERIACDLTALGCEPCPHEAHFGPEFTSFPHALGALYVLEGSTLGGRIILRHLETHTVDIPSDAMSFFAGHGAETGSMWRAFVAKLDTFGALNPDACTAAKDGAQSAFRTVIAWFEPFCARMRRCP